MNSTAAMAGKTPRWMRLVLLAAALYNIAWAIWTVFWPSSMFSIAGMEPPRYPFLWQGLGMMVGVFGLGYVIAATNPFRHWLIVLLGLLGKFLGPVGLLLTVGNTGPTTAFALTLIVSDVIWWVPFGLIVYRALQNAQAEIADGAPEFESVDAALQKARTTCCLSLNDLSHQSPVLLVFLRHFGCTFCMEALSDLARDRERIQAGGTRIVLIHMSSNERATEVVRSYGLYGIDHVSDRSRRLYRAFGFTRGTFGQVLGPSVWWRALHAMIRGGHGVGELEGDGFQMPGLVLISEGRVVRRFAHRTAGQRPDYVAFSTAALSEIKTA